METWTAIGLRFAAYVDLMLLVGLLMGSGLGRYAPAINPRLIGWAAAFGLFVTVGQFLATCLSMTGDDIAALDQETLTFLAFDTPMGVSHIVRATALGLLVILASNGRAGRPIEAVLAITALGSLAWSGHAAASEAAIGWVHRSSDIVHLVAGAVWIAALVMLTRLLITSMDARETAVHALAALERFSAIGAVVVTAIAVTGLINLLAIVGIGGLTSVFANEYGRLLLLKLALFLMMLGLAGLNRWRLVPRLRATLDEKGSEAVLKTLRRTIAAETSLAFVVLAVVAMLGTISPSP
jgi:putative copper resistance protein D